jgi:hypothetical protein
MIALGIALISLSVREHRDAAHSSYTQAHGVRRAARVISEDVGTGKDPTEALVVRLSGPVNGHGTTTVHIQHIQDVPTYSPGAPLTVVVDPQDPAYAELPGFPYTSTGQWVLALVIGLADTLLATLFLCGGFLYPLRRRRRLRRSLPR